MAQLEAMRCDAYSGQDKCPGRAKQHLVAGLSPGDCESMRLTRTWSSRPEWTNLPVHEFVRSSLSLTNFVPAPLASAPHHIGSTRQML